MLDPWIRRKERQRAASIRREWLDVVGRDREWWRKQSIRDRTDWSSLLRQRIRVKSWLKAGAPPLAQWVKQEENDGIHEQTEGQVRRP